MGKNEISLIYRYLEETYRVDPLYLSLPHLIFHYHLFSHGCFLCLHVFAWLLFYAFMFLHGCYFMPSCFCMVVILCLHVFAWVFFMPSCFCMGAGADLVICERERGCDFRRDFCCLLGPPARPRGCIIINAFIERLQRRETKRFWGCFLTSHLFGLIKQYTTTHHPPPTCNNILSDFSPSISRSINVAPIYSSFLLLINYM